MQEQSPESAPSNESSPNKAKEIKRVRVYSAYVLPSDRYPLSVHLEILRRYVNLARTTPLSADKVDGPGIPVQSAAMNVRFLRDIGLLKAEARGQYSPTEQAIAFIYARTADENRAKAILRQVLQDKWFTDATLAHLKTDPITTREHLLNELALVAQTDRQVKGPALAVLVDYLVYAGIINEDEQGIRVGVQLQSTTPSVSGVASNVSMTGPNVTTPAKPASPAIEIKPITEAAATAEEWQVIQTEDFYVKVRSDLDVIADLRDAIDLLEKKAKRNKEKQSQQSDKKPFEEESS